MDAVLFREPWIDYTDEFVRERIVLPYPKNVVFVAQFLLAHLDKVKNGIYESHPLAEKFDVESLNGVDWEKSLIVVDRKSQLQAAPEPVKKLYNLDRRLDPKSAEQANFGGFRVFPA